MIRIINIDQLSVYEIEDILNKNEDWGLISFGSNVNVIATGHYSDPETKKIKNNFMAVKPVVDHPKDFRE